MDNKKTKLTLTGIAMTSIENIKLPKTGFCKKAKLQNKETEMLD